MFSSWTEDGSLQLYMCQSGINYLHLQYCVNRNRLKMKVTFTCSVGYCTVMVIIRILIDSSNVFHCLEYLKGCMFGTLK